MKIEDTSIHELLQRSVDKQLNFEVGTINQNLIKVIKQYTYVKQVEIVGKVIKVKVDDTVTCKNALLKSALEHNIDINKFEIYNETLEEIFLKLVVAE